MIPVQLAHIHGKRIPARSENLSRAERAVAITRENGGIAIITAGVVPRTNHEQIGVAVAVEISGRDSRRILSDGEVLRWLEGSVTIPYQDAHAAVLTYVGVPEVKHRNVRFAVVV